jgi:serine protease Do
MSIDSIEGHWHGLVTRTLPRSKEVLVERVMPGSPADDAGVRPGDTLTQAGSVKIERALDIERALLGQSPATDIPVDVIRGGEAKTLAMHIARRPGHAVRKSFEAAVVEPSDRTWDLLGLSLVDEPSSTFARSGTKYTGGVRVKQVRPGSSAAAEGIREGDILVGVHRWQTSSMQDVEYIVSRTNVSQMGPVKFYILRGNDTFYGQVKVASQSTASRR